MTSHLRKEGIITIADKKTQAEWMLRTKGISGKPMCLECYNELKKLGYIKD